MAEIVIVETFDNGVRVQKTPCRDIAKCVCESFLLSRQQPLRPEDQPIDLLSRAEEHLNRKPAGCKTNAPADKNHDEGTKLLTRRRNGIAEFSDSEPKKTEEREEGKKVTRLQCDIEGIAS